MSAVFRKVYSDSLWPRDEEMLQNASDLMSAVQKNVLTSDGRINVRSVQKNATIPADNNDGYNDGFRGSVV